MSSKAGLEGWESCARHFYSSSFHSYTQALSQRRKFGAARLGTFDAVMSTLGVLAAKECSVPAFSLTDDAGYESNEDDDQESARPINSCDDEMDKIGSDNWLRRRRSSNMKIE